MNHPDRAVALLRVVVGAWFIKAVWTKVSYAIVAGVIPYPMVSPRFIAFHPKRVAEFAAGNPIGWYRDFLQTTVLPHAEVFATLQTIGEVVVGVGLLLGIMTRLAAAVGLFLALNYGLANQIRAADSENGWWSEGVWSRLGVRGEQWKMGPYGFLSNLSTTNITYLNVCINENDLEY